MSTVAVIGGGPAGMMAAISAAKEGANVTLYEKNEKLGKKLYITGKGRCNLTNTCDVPDIFEKIVTNRKFAYSAIYSFSNEDAVSFFEKNGLELKEERGKRIFPASDKSSDVIKTLERALKKAGVSVLLNREVKDPLSLLESEGGEYDSVIIATGGLSYPTTGSTGDGYRFAENLGHKIVSPIPALVPLTVSEKSAGRMQGLSLKNIQIRILDENNRELYRDFGEMLFTSDGVSGPVILSASSVIGRRLDAGNLKLVVDLKPALDEKTLDTRILKDFGEAKNKDFRNSLSRLLPSSMIPVIVDLSGIDEHKKVNEITKAERTGLVRLIKNLTFTVNGTEGFSQAVITQGGVDVKGIDPKTMESKLYPRIFFAGEVLDIDAFTGGFNIQIALSTGYLAGKAAGSLNKQ